MGYKCFLFLWPTSVICIAVIIFVIKGVFWSFDVVFLSEQELIKTAQTLLWHYWVGDRKGIFSNSS